MFGCSDLYRDVETPKRVCERVSWSDRQVEPNADASTVAAAANGVSGCRAVCPTASIESCSQPALQSRRVSVNGHRHVVSPGSVRTFMLGGECVCEGSHALDECLALR